MPVLRVLPSYKTDMNGVPLLQPLPTQQIRQLDPFLLVHHHHISIPADSYEFREGVGPHPHRGFTPITFLFQGGVHHRDSRGNSSIVTAGGVQWMDVGMGVIHSERPPANLCREGGVQELVQIWVNLPASLKFMEPHYQGYQKEELLSIPDHPEVRITSGAPIVHSGTGPLKSAYPIAAAHGTILQGATIEFHVPDDHNAMLYLLSGGGRLVNYGLAEAEHLYELGNGNQVFEAKVDTKFLFLSAPPIGEKVEQYGPYVMNNQTEIMEALRDYQMGKMGFLVEQEL